MDEERFPFTELALDDENPRLPEKLVHASQPEILKYMYENAVLQELARSYVNNGFFQVCFPPFAPRATAGETSNRLSERCSAAVSSS